MGGFHGNAVSPCVAALRVARLCEQKFQEIEEAHLRQMKQLIKGYSHSIEDTHVQVGQVCAGLWGRGGVASAGLRPSK